MAFINNWPEVGFGYTDKFMSFLSAMPEQSKMVTETVSVFTQTVAVMVLVTIYVNGFEGLTNVVLLEKLSITQQIYCSQRSCSKTKRSFFIWSASNKASIPSE